MQTLRRWIGVLALLLAGVTLALIVGNTVVSAVVLLCTGAGALILGVGVMRRRPDPYDLRLLDETPPMPEDGREGPEDRTGYCPVCGHFIESPYEPCPRCGSAI